MIQVNGLLDHVADLVDRFHLVNLRPQIAACQQQLGEPERIDVAVFGRFKAGKSSFLNHLAGRAVLPIGVLPLTAIVTRLRYGPVERAVVRFSMAHEVNSSGRHRPLRGRERKLAQRQASGGRGSGVTLAAIFRPAGIRGHAGPGQRFHAQHRGYASLAAQRGRGPGGRERRRAALRTRPELA